MGYTPKILAFAGSLREGSYNKKLVKIAAEGARGAGAEVTYLDLRDLDLPIFDEDLEKRVTLPPGGRRLKELMRANDGFLVSGPEYNSSISAALKNAIDWASRPEPDHPPLSCFIDKVGGLMSASPGALGGIRSLVHLRAILGHLQMLLIGEQFALPKAAEAFDEKGGLKDEKQRRIVEGIGEKVARTITKLRAG